MKFPHFRFQIWLEQTIICSFFKNLLISFFWCFSTSRVYFILGVFVFLCLIFNHLPLSFLKSIPPPPPLKKKSLIKARFKRRTFHVPNLMLMRKNNRFCSLALDSAHEKFDVWTGPNCSVDSSFDNEINGKKKQPREWGREGSYRNKNTINIAVKADWKTNCLMNL